MPIKNVYHTTDPKILFALKQQESDAILDVIRSINSTLTRDQLLKIVANTIHAQLLVRKLKIINKRDGELHVDLTYGFPALANIHLNEISEMQDLTKISASIAPNLFDLGVEYVIPIKYMSKIEAHFIVADFADSIEEALNDLIFIETIGTIMVTSIHNRINLETLHKQQILQRELDIAESIQQSLLSTNFNIHQNFDIAAHHLPHYKVGGDLYDFFKINDCIYFCIADVAGKGVGSALLMANFQASFRSIFSHEKNFSQAALKLNNATLRITKKEKFITSFIGRIHIQTLKLTYLNSGHNPPVHIRENNITELRTGSFPFGIFKITELEIGELQLKKDDLIYTYTDGVVEQTNSKNDQFGSPQLKQLILKHSNDSCEKIIEKTVTAVNQHRENIDYHDDLTLFLIRTL